MRRVMLAVLVLLIVLLVGFVVRHKSLDSIVLGRWTRTQSFIGIGTAMETAEFTADHSCVVTLDADVPGLKVAHGTKLIDGTWTIEDGKVVVREKLRSNGLLHVGRAVSLQVAPDGSTISVVDSNIAGVKVSTTFKRE